MGSIQATPIPVSLSRHGTQSDTPTADHKPDTDREGGGGAGEEATQTLAPPNQLHSSSFTPSAIDAQRLVHLKTVGPLEAISLHSLEKPTLEKSSSKEEEFLGSLSPPSTITTVNGRGQFADLFLPPPPTPPPLPPSPTKSSLTVSRSRAAKTPSPSGQKSSLLRSKSTTPTTPKHSPSASRKQVGGRDSVEGPSRKSSEKTVQRVASEREKLLQPKRAKFCQIGKAISGMFG